MAGEETHCSQCGNALEIPQLKLLRQLAPEEVAQVTGKKNSSNSPLSNFLFVLGLLLLILGSIGGVGLYFYGGKMFVDFSSAKEQIEQQASTLSSGGVLREWYLAEKRPELPEWREHPAIRYQKQGAILQRFAVGFAAIGGIGIVLVVSGVVLGSRRQ